MSDRIFAIAFGVSLGVHLLLLLGELLSVSWLNLPKRPATIEVIYEEESPQQALRILQEQLSRAKRETVASPAPSRLAERTQIRVPDRPSLTAAQNLDEILPDHVAVVDLTDLVDASRGNPVLLSYFSAIRQQIQQTANLQPWLAGATSAGGLVYISFDLVATGDIRGVSVVADRSAPSDTLRNVALRIVEQAAPFPAFPPSIPEPSKTIVVPLEFLLGP